MQVEQGWSGEVRPNQWAKIKIVLDETDLRRMLHAEGYPALDPATLPVMLVYKLLDIEAERLLLGKLAARYGQLDEHRPRLVELRDQRAQALDVLRGLLGPVNDR